MVRALNLIKVVWPILIAFIIIGIAWGTQRGQVDQNCKDIAAIKLIADSNKVCIIRIETKLENFEKVQAEQRREMRVGFDKLEKLIKDGPS